MMYDDIAEQGVVVQYHNGPNVYEGVPKNYTGGSVTSENFLQVLQGQNIGVGSAKVIASGPNDRIFVFSGHGGPGFLQFPNGRDRLFAKKFIGVIKKMHKDKKYAKMVVYVEACYAGSMFRGRHLKDLNLYATTAANASEYSYSLWPGMVKGVPLGNVYSVNWMEHSEKSNLMVTTVSDQYNEVRRKTKGSRVTQYGDSSMGKLYLSEFQGRKNPRQDTVKKGPCKPIPNWNVHIAILDEKILNAKDASVKKSLQQKRKQTLENRDFFERKIAEIATFIAAEKKDKAKSLLTSEKDVINFDCYEAALRHFEDRCFSLSANPYALHHLRVLVNACESGFQMRDITSAIDSACTHPTIRGIV
ncbi:hypothetical protein V5799_032271 [Amblyomma americanum]|uniref:Legumain prodomain domain-containing protein n=1 Tax=Amblyomma americanum TaxID=6943 RepID=A0AAQ4DRN1_AMBAM